MIKKTLGAMFMTQAILGCTTQDATEGGDTNEAVSSDESALRVYEAQGDMTLALYRRLPVDKQRQLRRAHLARHLASGNLTPAQAELVAEVMQNLSAASGPLAAT